MRKLLLILSVLACAALAQSTGTVVVSQPTPGKFVATAGLVSCTVTGNAVPATAVTVTCTFGNSTIQPYLVPMPPGAAYTFQQNYSVPCTSNPSGCVGDAVTVVLQSDSAGKISWQAVATPAAGATSGNVTGIF